MVDGFGGAESGEAVPMPAGQVDGVEEHERQVRIGSLGWEGGGGLVEGVTDGGFEDLGSVSLAFGSSFQAGGRQSRRTEVPRITATQDAVWGRARVQTEANDPSMLSRPKAVSKHATG